MGGFLLFLLQVSRHAKPANVCYNLPSCTSLPTGCFLLHLTSLCLPSAYALLHNSLPAAGCSKRPWPSTAYSPASPSSTGMARLLLLPLHSSLQGSVHFFLGCLHMIQNTCLLGWMLASAMRWLRAVHACGCGSGGRGLLKGRWRRKADSASRKPSIQRTPRASLRLRGRGGKTWPAFHSFRLRMVGNVSASFSPYLLLYLIPSLRRGYSRLAWRNLKALWPLLRLLWTFDRTVFFLRTSANFAFFFF